MADRLMLGERLRIGDDQLAGWTSVHEPLPLAPRFVPNLADRKVSPRNDKNAGQACNTSKALRITVTVLDEPFAEGAPAMSLQDVLMLDLHAAVLQLESLERRSVPEPGIRQSPFLPVETVLCLAAMSRIDHRRFGGSTSHLAGSPVRELAQLFRRPPSSVLAKMANLDGSRRNGARWDIPVAQELLADRGIGLQRTYAIIMLAARRIGIGPDRLPDFLTESDADDWVPPSG